MSTFSRTVSSRSSVSCWGTTPSRARIFGPSAVGSSPRMRSVPPLSGETQPIMRIVELLPAPLGPRKPKASPRLTSRSIPSTATRSPKRLTRPRAWIIGPFSLTAATYLRGPDGSTGRLDVARDLVDQLLLALEHLLVPQPFPQLDDQPPAVQVALEVEQVRLDPALLTAVVRVRPDRDRRPMVQRGAGVDPVPGHEHGRVDAEVRGRVAERAAPLVARNDEAVELGRAPEQARRLADLAGVQVPPDLRRRHAREQRHRPHLVPEPGQQVEVAAALAA